MVFCAKWRNTIDNQLQEESCLFTVNLEQFLWNLCVGLITDKHSFFSLSRGDNLVTSLNHNNYTIHGKIIVVNYLPIIDENRKHNMQLVRFSCFCEYNCHILMMKSHSQ